MKGGDRRREGWREGEKQMSGGRERDDNARKEGLHRGRGRQGEELVIERKIYSF